jgi:hypothetical protein
VVWRLLGSSACVFTHDEGFDCAEEGAAVGGSSRGAGGELGRASKSKKKNEEIVFFDLGLL